ncbi:MAG: DUF721 domain-containing protein [Bacteroidetes bacterium]|nr:MAG: DUF721 domain-containing protein [Bacteroidota bacterium]
MPKSNETTLKEAIEELLKAYRLNGKLNEVKLKHVWEKITGNYIARETESVILKGNILQIKLKSPVIRQELGYARTKLVDKINEELGEKLIEDILFY